MKKVLKKVISLSIIAGILFLSGSVRATGSEVGITMNSNSNLKKGEIITVNVNVTKISEQPIGCIIGNLKYDNNILEYVNARTYGDWQEAIFAPKTEVFGIERNNFTTTSKGKIASIDFKVKELSESTTISYNVTDVGFKEYVNIPASVTIKAVKENIEEKLQTDIEQTVKEEKVEEKVQTGNYEIENTNKKEENTYKKEKNKVKTIIGNEIEAKKEEKTETKISESNKIEENKEAKPVTEVAVITADSQNNNIENKEVTSKITKKIVATLTIILSIFTLIKFVILK